MAANTIDETSPADSDPIAQGALRIRQLKVAIQTAIRTSGATEAQPDAGGYGFFFDTTRNVLQMDNGSAWIDIGAIEPAGVIKAYGGTAAPSGYLLCDGSAISRETYADLFDAIGTAYGSGNGTTTFNIPDLKGKVPFGKDDAGTFDTLGASGGTESHEHTVDAHSHSLNSSPGAIPGILQDASRTYTSTTNEQSPGTDEVSNVPPFQVVNYIIKT